MALHGHSKARASRAFGSDQSLLRRRKTQGEAARSQPKETSNPGETILTPIGGAVGLVAGGGAGLSAGSSIGGGLGGLFDAGATSDPEESEAKALANTQRLVGGVSSAVKQGKTTGATRTAGTEPIISDEEIDKRLRNLFIRSASS